MILRVVNTTALVAGLLGQVFRMQHWAGANGLLLLGFGALLVSTLLLLRGRDPDHPTGPLNYLLVATLATATLSVLGKLLYWPGVGVLGLLAVSLALVASIWLTASAQPIARTRQLLTVAFVFFTLFFATLLLPL